MSPRRVLFVVGLATLLTSCNKQKAESEAPADDAAKDVSGAVGDQQLQSVDAAAQLASLEAELSARKAELSTRGIAFGTDVDAGDASPSGTTPPGTTSAGTTSPGTTSPGKDAVQLPTTMEPPRDRPAPRRELKSGKKKRPKAKKSHRTVKVPPAKASAEPDACAPICRPADAICDLAARICGLAAEHEEEDRYVDACERAEEDCERAADACEECRG